MEVVAWRQARLLLLDDDNARATSFWFRGDLEWLLGRLEAGAIQPRVAEISFEEVTRHTAARGRQSQAQAHSLLGAAARTKKLTCIILIRPIFQKREK